MRALLVLAVILLLLFVVGWITVGDSPDRSTINLEKQEIREDTAGMVEQGNEFLDKAREAVTSDAATLDAAPAPVDPSDPIAAPPLVETDEPTPQPPLSTREE